MKLSLSVRAAESPRRKDVAAVPFDELSGRAASAGFQGLSIRASVVSIASAPEEVAAVRRRLDELALSASMVTGDLALAVNNAQATGALRAITPYLDLAAALGCRLVRVMMHDDDDIAPAQEAADAARARGMALCHQTHWGSLFETVEMTLETLARIDRANFGVTYEPANLLACGGPHGAEAIRRLAPHIFNVYFQNLRLDPAGPQSFETRSRGRVALGYVGLGDSSGIDPRPLLEALAATGYNGWFTVHQPLLPEQTVAALIDEAAALLLPLI